MLVPLLGTAKATKKPTEVPSVLAVAMIAVAVARSWTGNQSADSSGGHADSKVPATPFASIETTEATS